MPETGFTGPVSALNQRTVAYPGSIRTRFSARKPQSHTYAGYAPAFAVKWPANVKDVCDHPGPAPDKDPLPVHLAAVDRGIAQCTFDRISESIAAFEGSPEVSPFSSKYD